MTYNYIVCSLNYIQTKQNTFNIHNWRQTSNPTNHYNCAICLQFIDSDNNFDTYKLLDINLYSCWKFQHVSQMMALGKFIIYENKEIWGLLRGSLKIEHGKEVFMFFAFCIVSVAECLPWKSAAGLFYHFVFISRHHFGLER